MTKVTVIIPVYNVENYIEQCLESVINQTLNDIEIICIDDCGSDNSMSIVQQYAEKDSRIKILKNETNQGLGVSRNAGINNAQSEYIFFLDSDDYIMPNILELLYNKMLITKSDIVVSHTKAFPDDDSEETKSRAEEADGWLDKIVTDNYQVTIENYIKSTEDLNCTVWGKLYSADFLKKNHLKFITEKVMHEDNGFWLKVCACMPNLAYINDVGVMYRMRKGSITDVINQRKLHDKKRKHLKLNMLDAFDYIDEYHKENAEFLKNQIKNSCLYNSFFEVRLSFLFRLRWAKDDKMISILGIPLYRERIKNNYKLHRLLGVQVYKKALEV